MDNFETIWTFATPHFRVELACAPEESPDLSWNKTGEIAKKIDRGEYVNVCFRVRVLFEGVTMGADYLGNSIYADVRDFRKEHVGARGQYGSYFVDMVREAISETRKQMRTFQTIKLRAA